MRNVCLYDGYVLCTLCNQIDSFYLIPGREVFITNASADWILYNEHRHAASSLDD